jgi:hypothetical protein
MPDAVLFRIKGFSEVLPLWRLWLHGKVLKNSGEPEDLPYDVFHCLFSEEKQSGRLFHRIRVCGGAFHFLAVCSSAACFIAYQTDS